VGLVDEPHATASHELESIEAGDHGDRRRRGFEAGGDGDIGSFCAKLRKPGLCLGAGALSSDVAPQAPLSGDLIAHASALRAGIEVGKDRGLIGGGEKVVEEVEKSRPIRAAW
jgi:hypothetical protein